MARGAAPAVLLAVLVAGCGSGQNRTSPRTTAPSRTIPKSIFIKRADRLCAKSRSRNKRLEVPPLPPRTDRQLDDVFAFFRAQVTIASHELTRIRRLGIAVPGRAAQARNLDAADDMVAEMVKTAFHAHRIHLVRTRRHYLHLQALSARATRLAVRFGYQVCGQGGIHSTLKH